MSVSVGSVHTVYRQGNWLNEIEGEGELLGHFITKESAVSAGRQEAIKRDTEHVIHNQDGTVEEWISYGDDPLQGTG